MRVAHVALVQMQKWQGFWTLGARLVTSVILGARSEMSYRVEDALTWFGDSAFESAPGTQIVNFVAALERITTTESFSTHKFCSRLAMLGYEEEKNFAKTYWDAFAVHTARSAVIHGGFSPTSTTFRNKVRLAHDLTRNVLFRGLEVHFHLDSGGKLSELADLQNFFTKQHSKWATVLFHGARCGVQPSLGRVPRRQELIERGKFVGGERCGTGSRCSHKNES